MTTKRGNVSDVMWIAFHVIFILLMLNGFYEYFIEIYVGGWVIMFIILHFIDE